MRAVITLDAYETPERELVLAQARRVLRRHAIGLATVVAVLVALELLSEGAPWVVYLALSVWVLGLAVYYRGRVRHGDERIREQQFRVEWRAGRSNDRLTTRT
jgi:4-hydroxybenzoate polyprenyltransferase